MNKNIVLVGLMGAGKTSVGKVLAQNINYEFIDTDELIEKRANKKISEIFDNYGEDYFRKLEAEVIFNISDLPDKVISIGGGAFENIENVKNLQKNGIIFYLKATPEILFQRIKKETHRPLLNNSNPLETLKNLLEKREKNYNLSDVIIETNDKNLDKVVNNIIEEYKCKQ